MARDEAPAFAGAHDGERITTRAGFVYLMASKRHGTLYFGVTSDLVARVFQHRNKVVEGFSRTWGCTTLVWYEAHDDLQSARHRELQMKKWKRNWKIELIEQSNPRRKDLWEEIARP